jgi:hypothetical protein
MTNKRERVKPFSSSSNLSSVICHFLGPGLPNSPKEAQRDEEHKQGKELTPRERPSQRGIRYAESFSDDAHDRIEKEKATGRESIRFAESETNGDQADEK